jgi:tetratricopeptide (TPR) repeat protein
MKSLCLVLALRVGSDSIRRCLESVKSSIGYWVICDGGLSDGARRVIQDVLGEIPGELVKTVWVDAAHNLKEALKLARGRGDYHLFLDPDMAVSVSDEFRRVLEADSYLVKLDGPEECWVERLVSDRHDWVYQGSAYPFVRAKTATRRERLHGLKIVRQGEREPDRSARKEEIELLKKDVERGINVARCAFYVAQCYREIGNIQQAIEWYERRSTMGGWAEEAWYSLYQVARLQQRMGISWMLVLNQYLRAYEFRPTRAEPLYHIARFYRESRQWHLGYLFSSAGYRIPYPDDLLFIDRAVYEYGLALEHALCCRELGRHDEAVEAAEKVLASASAPEDVRELAEGCLRARGVSGVGRTGLSRIADSQSPIANVEYAEGNGETVETVGAGEGVVAPG